MVQFARCLHGMTRAKFKFLNQCIFFINFEDSASNFGYVNRFVPSDIKIRREPVACLKLLVITSFSFKSDSFYYTSCIRLASAI